MNVGWQKEVRCANWSERQLLSKGFGSKPQLPGFANI